MNIKNMQELSLQTVQILVISKILFFTSALILFVLLQIRSKPWTYLLLINSVIVLFYFVISWKLQKMFWGNSGDEVFILAFLTKALNFQFGSDFYYNALPNFYPPLYFWVTGFVSNFFTTSGIVAAKIGVLGTLILWFSGFYFWQKLFWSKVDLDKENKSIVKSQWFWLLFGLIFFVTLDFGKIITKPYETLSALFSVALVGFIAESFKWKKWNYKNYIFIGLSGVILFLTYYFWWFAMIPSIFVLVVLFTNKRINLKRIIYIGIIIFIFASLYLIPLLLSFNKFGIENWQATFSVPQNFNTFVPWSDLSLKSILLFFGLCGLIFGYKKSKYIQAVGILFITTFVYQFINIIYFLPSLESFQSSKPFLFLGGACLSAGSAYLFVDLYKKFNYDDLKKRLIVFALLIFFLPLMPFVKFIENPDILNQIEKNLKEPEIKKLANYIKENIDSFDKKVWLSSGTPRLNAYLPLSYYIAHNPHFSHQASRYSERMKEVENMSIAKSPENFMKIINNNDFDNIDGMILYYDKDTNSYPLHFWGDNFPNGGKEFVLYLPVNIVNDEYWELHRYAEWYIFVKK